MNRTRLGGRGRAGAARSRAPRLLEADAAAFRFRIDCAARCIVAGGIVAYPTEAVYGVGCLPLHTPALERILALKRRDAAKGLILVAARIEQLAPFAEWPGGEIGRAIRSSWPGPVTWVVPARRGLPAALTGGRGTIAVRVSRHPIVRGLCDRAGSALVSTSANLSGRPPARSALAVRSALGARVDFVLAGLLGGRDRPTEIREAVTGKVLRRA